MQEQTIKLMSVEDITEFANAAEKCDFPVTVSRKGYSLEVDGRSVIGLTNLMGGNMIVHYGGENEEFTKVLQKYRN